MDLKLEKKNFVIAGASKGIGAKIAERFLEEGANVILLARNYRRLRSFSTKLISSFGEDRVLFYSTDCCSLQAYKQTRKKILSTCKKIDGVISNVGNGESVPDPIPSEKNWAKFWSINFDSALNSSRLFLGDLKKTKGSLIFISSIAGIESIMAPTDYSVAKSSVNALAKTLSKKVATEIRVNVVAPGNIYYPGGTWDKKLKKDAKTVKGYIKDNVPLKRFGLVEEEADSVIFLSSPKCSFTTGSILRVDGGQTVSI